MSDVADAMKRKQRLIADTRAHLQSERAAMTRLAKDAADAAAHEENRPEGDKDMRSTEASYVARGQAERVRAIEHTLALLSAMECKVFANSDPITVSALVTTECRGERARYFLLPSGGGIALSLDGEKVMTLATTSPLGRALLGLREGDEAETPSPQGEKTHVVIAVG